MHGLMSRCLAILALAAACFIASPAAAQSEKRIALVIGNGAYPQGALATTANDAGLIAQTLQAAGFDVVGARDLDGDTLRHTLHDFVQKAVASGPDTVAMVYLAGYGLQVSGENYFLPIDANVARDSDLPVEGVRIGDYIHQLATLRLRVGVVVVDAARAYPAQLEGEPLAGGFALVEPDPNMLVAFNATPGTVGPNEPGPYGAYAQALAEMIRTGGLTLPDVFNHVRLRVNELTQGALVPWNAQHIQTSFMFFERAPDAPQAAPPAEVAQAQTRQIRDFPAPDAYAAALERDTLTGYEEFLAAYPRDPMVARVRAIVAARREAITWRRTFRADTPNAYWSYLRRYPHGPHAWDAHRRLEALAAALEPPPAFAAIDYDVPPPPPEEIDYVDRPVLAFDDPGYGFAPPPPAPVYFLPPPEPEFVVLPPPPPPVDVFVLPVPAFVVMPTYVVAPPYVVPPPSNIIFANIHNTTVINTVINRPAVTAAPAAGASNRPATATTSAPSAMPALPPSVQRKATLIQQQGPAAAGPRPTGPTPQANLPTNRMQPLPGVANPQPPRAPLVATPTTPLTNTRPTPTPPNARPAGPPTDVAPTTATHGPSPHAPSATAITPSTTHGPGPAPATAHAPPSAPQIADRPPPHAPPATAPPPANARVTPSTSAIHQPGPTAVTPARSHGPGPAPATAHAPPVAPRLADRPPPHVAPAVVNRPPPPPAINRAPPPPPVVNRAPPPAAVVNRSPPPPSPPPPRPAPPPPVVNRAPPPPPPHPAAAAAKKCVVENGKQVCR
jgi:uncharacterized caspase-like protein